MTKNGATTFARSARSASGGQVDGHKAALAPPAGVRDLLPPESAARRRVAERLQAVFERHGYLLVSTPLFEDAEVFERSPGGDPADLLRFVEPDSGGVAALRPDITPQIARVVASRMADQPGPWRLRYDGKIIRRRRGRARKQRQITQVGVELIGLAGAEADAEVISMAAQACTDVGLRGFQIELSPLSIAWQLLLRAGVQDMDAAAFAMARKDEPELEKALKAGGVLARDRKRILSLSELYGGIEVIRKAERLLKDTAAAKSLGRLNKVVQLLDDAGFGDHVGIDFGELRGHTYYTGLSFAILADGPGEPVASGGRYDKLLGLYGFPQPATGVALDLENLLWAAGTDAMTGAAPARVAITGSTASARKAAQALHGVGMVAATLPKQSLSEARGYAKAWGFDGAAVANGTRVEVARASSAQTRTVKLTDTDGLAALGPWLRGAQEG